MFRNPLAKKGDNLEMSAQFSLKLYKEKHTQAVCNQKFFWVSDRSSSLCVVEHLQDNRTGLLSWNQKECLLLEDNKSDSWFVRPSNCPSKQLNNDIAQKLLRKCAMSSSFSVLPLLGVILPEYFTKCHPSNVEQIFPQLAQWPLSIKAFCWITRDYPQCVRMSSSLPECQ